MAVATKQIIEKRDSFKSGFVLTAEEAIKTDGEVLFWWECLCSINKAENAAASILLNHITHLYVTIRGFSYASKWMEQYKQETGSQTQKTKSLRSRLQVSD